jgi:hypothetical protein
MTNKTRKISQQSRYVVEKRELELDYDCQHPMCETLHKRWRVGGVCQKPTAQSFDWIIWDNTRKEQVENFEYARDAKAKLAQMIAGLSDEEWRSIST